MNVNQREKYRNSSFGFKDRCKTILQRSLGLSLTRQRRTDIQRVEKDIHRSYQGLDTTVSLSTRHWRLFECHIVLERRQRPRARPGLNISVGNADEEHPLPQIVVFQVYSPFVTHI